MLERAFFSATRNEFLRLSPETIIGRLAQHHSQDIVLQQTWAWREQIKVIRSIFEQISDAFICFELLIPRMGRRVDVVLLIDGMIFCLEFKVGEKSFHQTSLRQAEGYALDLSHFHEASHNKIIIPILIATDAPTSELVPLELQDQVAKPLRANAQTITELVSHCLLQVSPQEQIEPEKWLKASYKPTPTIIQAAQALYAHHDVTEISRGDAEAINLTDTSEQLLDIIHHSRLHQQKTICFVTGVPGAGKTLVGLNVANGHFNRHGEEQAVFLSGNGPLVHVLREALARDRQDKSKRSAKTLNISEARRETEAFIQNIHHFRDEMLTDADKPPHNHVVIFDEAQRAWNREKAVKFMRQKRGVDNFDQSEAEFLISVMDRHKDWTVIIALIGGGQEIHDGEAGLKGWFTALSDSFPDWKVYYSPQLMQAEYVGDSQALQLEDHQLNELSSLHLASSMRSFRAERVSHFVHYIIHNQPDKACQLSRQIQSAYPFFVTRDLEVAKRWVKGQCRGEQSAGIIASSNGKRLKANGVFVDNQIDPANWFLGQRQDVRSSHFLEDVGTEFLVQGLELDWTIVCWDADFRYQKNQFEYWRFRGANWQRRLKEADQNYLANAYRVLLSRARQGMVIFIPAGDNNDSTRQAAFYQQTYDYLLQCGVKTLD
ncbi:DUF2075 domain-containing protein [uncultured Methylophaga sp.]|uniref:DUF2075 domain-containing protein n=1 Tax=uncultured Methylophaga sp. TaxID=285271 RepID=UPI0026241166|nr:DUF2075 domain-containing protein [uncultured Methylophaga sp.]